MKLLLPRDRAASAVPARSSLAARLGAWGAWARESLLARAIAIVLGLLVLAMIGGSAFAGGSGQKALAGSVPPASNLAPGPPDPVADAGVVPTTRPELLPPVVSQHPSASNEPTAPNPGNGASATNATRATPDDPVDLNTARLEDLRRLPGIGAKRAESILALRARLPGGRFRQLEDLLKVKGVGRSMIKRLHPLVRLSGAPE